MFGWRPRWGATSSDECSVGDPGGARVNPRRAGAVLGATPDPAAPEGKGAFKCHPLTRLLDVVDKKKTKKK